jgi:protocatechuate 3,4-dioxygenase beta subunit
MDERLTRASLLRLAGFAAAGIGLGASEAGAASGGPTAVASGLVSCVLTPEQTEGPYYIANERVRRNITEGRPGLPLVLRLSVVDVSTCRPIKGAAVDIWHCDAGGLYSGWTHGGQPGSPTDKLTFLRGIQRTDPSGVATFQTIYPGWYQGRTVHVHVKVHVAGNVAHTGQLYFPDSLTDAVYRKSPYARRAAGRTTRNSDDAVFRNGGKQSMLRLRKNSTGGYVGRITMGVHGGRVGEGEALLVRVVVVLGLVGHRERARKRDLDRPVGTRP